MLLVSQALHSRVSPLAALLALSAASTGQFFAPGRLRLELSALTSPQRAQPRALRPTSATVSQPWRSPLVLLPALLGALGG